MSRLRRTLARALGAAAVASLSVGVAAWPAPAALAAPARPAGRAQAALQPWPVTVTIRTVPKLPGIGFLFDGVPLATGPDGAASVTERHNFSAHTLSLAQTQVSGPGRRYTFVRWAGQRDPDQAFRPVVHGLPMRADYTVTASFAVDCRVSPRLARQDGTALPGSQVSRITLRSSLGQIVPMRPDGATWLRCAVPVYRDSRLSSHPVKYSVQDMVVGGGNVVHAGVERFTPSRASSPRLTGFFYALTITAHDALLGGPVGSYAVLTMPDRTIRRVKLGPGHTATVSGLPLGDYRVQVKAGGARISTQLVHLSRNETVNLAAISQTDITVIAGILVAGLAGIPLLSRTRRQRLRALARHVYAWARHVYARARRARNPVRRTRPEPEEEAS